MHYQVRILVLFLPLFLFYQPRPALAQDREDRRFTNRMEPLAREYFRIGDYPKALEGFLMLDSLNPGNTDYNYHIGLCYLRGGVKSKAYPYLEFAYQQEDAPENILLELGRAYHYGMEFEKAIILYQSYLRQVQHIPEHEKQADLAPEDIERFIQQCRNGQRLILDPVPGIVVINMGEAINTEFADFAPLVNREENLLIFTSKRMADQQTSTDPLTGQYFENVFYTTFIDGAWKPAQSIGPPINKPDVHNAAVGLSPSGDLLFLYQGDDNRFASRVSGDLYTSRKVNGQWGEPTFLSNINSRYWEPSATVSEDETVLVFSSDRDGGYGGTDLYITRKAPDGNWTDPVNLGPYINTSSDEDGPFLHPEGNMIYFSSRGHNSMGGYDVFYSRYLPDEQRWTRPENMGYPISTPDDDVFFVWSEDGERAYFSSVRSEGFGDTDIYMITRNTDRQERVHIKGIVRDRIDQKSIDAEIHVRDLLNNNLIGVYRTDADGSYTIPLPSDHRYRIDIHSEGYEDFNYTLDVSSGQERDHSVKNITLTREN